MARERRLVVLMVHADHVAPQKLWRNRPLTQTDPDELERMFTEAGIGDPTDLARARTEADGLGVFIRSLVGLDRDAASDAVAGFVDGRTLTADQLDFIALVVRASHRQPRDGGGPALGAAVHEPGHRRPVDAVPRR